MTLVHGCAHVGGKYWVNTPATGSFIKDGAKLIDDLGFGSIKLFLSDIYATDYSFDSLGTNTTLAQLAAHANFAYAISRFDTVFLNCFVIANQGHFDYWKFGYRTQTSYLDNEYDEIKALCDYLHATYAGKTFYISTWEGDWSLLTAFDTAYTYSISERRIALMTAYLRERVRAVDDSNAGNVGSGVSIHSAIEVNRVRDCLNDRNARRVLTQVLTRVRPSIVSYSAYDSVYTLQPGDSGSWHASAAAMLAAIPTRFSDAINMIRDLSGRDVYVGEWGVPENVLPVGYSTADIIDAVNSALDAKSITHSIYWQIFDNEGVPPANSGYWIYDDSGNLTDAGTKFQAIL